jgi:hypothetical protein
LNSFVDKHGLRKFINFQHQVLEVKKCSESKKWLVTVQSGVECEDIDCCECIPADPNAEPRTIAFDAIAVCTGTNTYSCLPCFPGQEKFEGEWVHSEYYETLLASREREFSWSERESQDQISQMTFRSLLTKLSQSQSGGSMDILFRAFKATDE